MQNEQFTKILSGELRRGFCTYMRIYENTVFKALFFSTCILA